MVSREDRVKRFAHFMNWVAAASIFGMMLLTTTDVVLRYFRRPIPGTYEIVGFLGSIAVGFALASTSVNRAHVAVSILFQRLPPKAQTFVDAFNSLVAAGFFGILTWQCGALAEDLRQAGEVSMTLEMPFYPFVYGISAGCAMLAVTLFVDFLDALKTFARR
jgi:TRAP-type C4-dicarboxylate transport system permease small subunit